jgi:FecR protein
MSDIFFRGVALYKNPICAASYFVCFVDAIFVNHSVSSVESLFKRLIGERPGNPRSQQRGRKKRKKDFTSAKQHTINRPMNMERCYILLVAPVAFALVNWLPNDLSAQGLEEAKVTQVVQDVKVVPAGAAARPAAVNETVGQGNAVQTGTQSRSELTFKDQTITRLGEKTIFNVGKEGRTIDMGNGQFLLYVPKNKGGAKIKMGPVTAAITGTTVFGNVYPSGIVEFMVLEGSACIRLDSVGQSLQVMGGQMVVYDPIAMRLEDPVEVDLQQQLSSPLIRDFRRLPSADLIEEEIQSQHQVVAPNGDLDRAVRAAGAASIATATPDQFMRGFSSLIVRYPPSQRRTLVAGAIRARPDLADRITAAAAQSRPVRGYYGKDAKDFKEYKGKEVAIPEPCPPFNQPVQPFIPAPLTPQVNSPEQPPTNNGD